MADVPINIVNLSVPFEDDPGSSSGGGSFDIAPLLEVTRSLNVSVSAINQNVRAILETLRVISRRGVAARGGASRTRGGGAPGGTDPDAARELREQQRQRLYAARRGISLTLSPEEEAMRRGEVMPSPGQESFYGSLFAVFDKQAAATSREVASGARDAMREEQERRRQEMRAQRESERAAQREALRMQREEQSRRREELRAAQRRMTNSQQNRIDEMRRMRGQGIAFSLTEEERALISGSASPSGLPGTRAFARELRRSQASAPQHGPQLPGAQQPAGSIGRTIMGAITMIGRVLSVARLIFGAVSTVIKVLSSLSRAAGAQRAALSGVDPGFAAMEASLMVGQLQADYATAQSPALRKTLGKLTDIQLARMQAQVPLRQIFGTIAAQGASAWEMYLLSLELYYGGALTGDTNAQLRGALIPLYGLFQLTPFAALAEFFGLNDTIRQWLIGQNTASARQSSNQIFTDDLTGMSAGMFGVNYAYPGGRPGSPPRGAGDWWR